MIRNLSERTVIVSKKDRQPSEDVSFDLVTGMFAIHGYDGLTILDKEEAKKLIAILEEYVRGK